MVVVVIAGNPVGQIPVQGRYIQVILQIIMMVRLDVMSEKLEIRHWRANVRVEIRWVRDDSFESIGYSPFPASPI